MRIILDTRCTHYHLTRSTLLHKRDKLQGKPKNSRGKAEPGALRNTPGPSLSDRMVRLAQIQDWPAPRLFSRASERASSS
jgi:hypothetical protein